MYLLKKSLLVIGIIGVMGIVSAADVVIDAIPPDVVTHVPPNLILNYDNSGSMGWDYMPDKLGNNSEPNQVIENYNYNPLAFNPNKTYSPWVKKVNYLSVTDTTGQVLLNNATINDTPYSGYSGSSTSTLTPGLKYKLTYACSSSSLATTLIYPSNSAKFASSTACNAANAANGGGVIATSSKATGQTFNLLNAENVYYYTIVAKTLTAANNLSNVGETTEVFATGTTINPVTAISTTNTTNQKGNCKLVDGYICTALGKTNLNLYQIKRNSFTSLSAIGQQNYLNWYMYHRIRQHLLSSSMSLFLPKLSAVNVGVFLMNPQASLSPTYTTNLGGITGGSITSGLYQTSSTAPTTLTNSGTAKSVVVTSGKLYNMDWRGSSTENGDIDELLNVLYNGLGSSATPTKTSMVSVGNIFKASNYIREKNEAGVLQHKNNGIIQYSCQVNAALLLSDGYQNETTYPSMGSYSGGFSATTYNSGVPYQDISSGTSTLANVANYFYTQPLRPSTTYPFGKVPVDNYLNARSDTNPNLHMNMYAILLGLDGKYFRSSMSVADKLIPPLSAVSGYWDTTPANNSPETIDDIWHATLVSRGQMYSASSDDEISSFANEIATEISSRIQSRSAVGVSTVNPTNDDNKFYSASYNTLNWSGELKQKQLDPVTGAEVINPALWTASILLDAKNQANSMIHIPI